VGGDRAGRRGVPARGGGGRLRGDAPRTAAARASRLTWVRLASTLRYLALLALGGYGVLLLVVLVFSVWLLGDVGALRSAAWGAPALLAIAVPVFVALAWLEGRLRG